MKIILQILVLLSLFISDSFGVQFANITQISLKKDEQKKILVKYDNYVKEFKLRWTLYTNEGLVVLSSYDKEVSQHMLYLNNINQSFRFNLKANGVAYYSTPYLLVRFKEFDYKKNKAIFELFLSDKKLQIQMEYLKNSSK